MPEYALPGRDRHAFAAGGPETSATLHATRRSRRRHADAFSEETPFRAFHTTVITPFTTAQRPVEYRTVPSPLSGYITSHACRRQRRTRSAAILGMPACCRRRDNARRNTPQHHAAEPNVRRRCLPQPPRRRHRWLAFTPRQGRRPGPPRALGSATPSPPLSLPEPPEAERHRRLPRRRWSRYAVRRRRFTPRTPRRRLRQTPRRRHPCREGCWWRERRRWRCA